MYNFMDGGSYLSAWVYDGFLTPLLLQLAEDLRRAMPRLLGPHELTNAWAFKHDNTRGPAPVDKDPRGVKIHADAAAVNVNIWLVPEDALQDPENAGGGIVVFAAEAPAHWSDADYNSLDPALKAERNARVEGVRRIEVPYRANRMVLFNSNLFHETAAVRFRPGYRNRRINLTLLFGDRCGGQVR